MSEPTHPNVSVELIGQDGNAFSIIGRVTKAIRSGEGTEAATAYTTAAMECESYDALLAFTMQTVEVF